MVKEKELEFAYYVGDPCYVISDERWSEFCDRLEAAEHQLKMMLKPDLVKEGIFVSLNGYGVDFEWPLADEEGRGDYINTATIEVWSTGGDGCWRFYNLADHWDKSQRPMPSRRGYELGVDAGIVAVVPYEACDVKTEQLGLYFDSVGWSPELETQDGGAEIRINGYPHDEIVECSYCGEEERIDRMSDCGRCWECY